MLSLVTITGATEVHVISNPDLTLYDAEMRDLEKFDTTPLFIGYCEEGCPENTLTVIGLF